MQTEQLDLGGIPPSCGDRRAMGRSLPSTAICPHKADTPIQLLAEAASARALQVLSFDLPDTAAAKTSLRRAGYKSAYPSLGP